MGGTEPTVAGMETTIDPPEPTTTGEDAGAPVFLSFSTNVKKLTDGESVTFTAILTDPDGVEDIVGGSLLSEDESIDFGPFIAAGQAGTYSIMLSWDQIHQADKIDFSNGEMSRVFAARFFDQAGHKVTEIVPISLYCMGGGACDGVCKDFSDDGENCGECGKSCDGGCLDGACGPNWSPCINSDDGVDTCEQGCANIQEACVENGCGNSRTVLSYGSVEGCVDNSIDGSESQPCGVPQPWGFGYKAIRCCCTDTK